MKRKEIVKKNFYFFIVMYILVLEMKILNNIFPNYKRIIVSLVIFLFLTPTFHLIDNYVDEKASKFNNNKTENGKEYDNYRSIDKHNLTSSYRQINHGSSCQKAIAERNNAKETRYIVHSPIEINSEEDFVKFGFPGSGTEADPYIIENYEVSTGDTEYLENSCGIVIRYVSSFVIIRNCFIQGYEVGISSETRAGGVIVENCTLLYNQYGVLVHQSGDSLIKNNYSANNSGFGILVSESSNVTIIKNTCITNGAGSIGVRDNKKIKIFYNNLEKTTNDWASCLWSSGNSEIVISDNLINGATSDGLYLERCNNVVISNNNIYNSTNFAISYGFEVSNSLIYNNLFCGTGLGGVRIGERGDYNIVFNNSFLKIQDNNEDYGTNTYWYSPTLLVGNLWEDWDGTTNFYSIYGNKIGDIFPRRVASVENDSDSDGMEDAWEIVYNLDDSKADSDGDGLSNLEEYQWMANPNFNDTDGDGLNDYDEVIFGGCIRDGDFDDDKLSDYEEVKIFHSFPYKKDSDSDGLTDYQEVIVFLTDPIDSDTDGDGLSDYEEIYAYHTDPTKNDTDDDKFNDYDEIIIYGSDPLNKLSNPRAKKIKIVLSCLLSFLVIGSVTTTILLIKKKQREKIIQLKNEYNKQFLEFNKFKEKIDEYLLQSYSPDNFKEWVNSAKQLDNIIGSYRSKFNLFKVIIGKKNIIEFEKVKREINDFIEKLSQIKTELERKITDEYILLLNKILEKKQQLLSDLQQINSYVQKNDYKKIDLDNYNKRIAKVFFEFKELSNEYLIYAKEIEKIDIRNALLSSKIYEIKNIDEQISKEELNAYINQIKIHKKQTFDEFLEIEKEIINQQDLNININYEKVKKLLEITDGFRDFFQSKLEILSKQITNEERKDLLEELQEIENKRQEVRDLIYLYPLILLDKKGEELRKEIDNLFVYSLKGKITESELYFKEFDEKLANWKENYSRVMNTETVGELSSNGIEQYNELKEKIEEKINYFDSRDVEIERAKEFFKVLSTTSEIPLFTLQEKLGFEDLNELELWLVELGSFLSIRIEDDKLIIVEKITEEITHAIDELIDKFSEWEKTGKGKKE
ncbi:MAG: right-handed parallel beta-helix repeat-containing protein [Candidatus Heimdallarchaeum aukensis]|uniref:Right-handed parallel beta-helix repeat-containing protein n=1 Tax=Candidatus Heimdallarchaeum aukensis TaxID=2876573 RepID=A0A9Y1BLL8_9ARCH|nr:MAG: right-handed parallel beta-helix repeat-containing protein [Candidatus Heimdallarchaeum aukensis]